MRLYKIVHGYHLPAERLSFSAEAKAVIEKVLEVRPTVLNLSAMLATTLVENFVKVKSSATSDWQFSLLEPSLLNFSLSKQESMWW